MKKFISLILVFCLLFSSLPLPSLAEDWPEGDETANAPEDEGGDYSGSLETPGLYVGPDEETDDETDEQPEEEPEQEPEEMPEEEADVPSDPTDETPTEEEEPARCDAIDRILDGDFTFADILLALETESEWGENTDRLNTAIEEFLLSACDSPNPEETLIQIRSVLAAAERYETEELTEALAQLEAAVFLKLQQEIEELPSALDLLRSDESAYSDYLSRIDALKQRLTILPEEQQNLLNPEPDYTSYLYTFTQTEDGWLIQAETEEGTVSLAPGAVPNHSGGTVVELTDFYLQSAEGYLTFGPVEPDGFGVSADEEEAVRLWLFREGNTYGWLNGFSIVDSESEIESGKAYLIGAVRFDAAGEAKLNLILPSSSSNPGNHYTELKSVPLRAETLPNDSAPTLQIDISVNWDHTTEYIDNNAGHFFAPSEFDSKYQTTRELLADNAKEKSAENPVIATVTYSVPQAGSWENNSYKTPFPLDDCLFTITANPDGSYLVQSKKNPTLYLTIGGSSSGRHAKPCSTDQNSISITPNSNGTYLLSSESNGYLWHIGSWNVFSNEAYAPTANAAHKGKDFYLFRKDGNIYYEITGNTIENGDYLIAAKTGGSAPWLIVRPNTDQGNNDSAASFLIPNRNGDNLTWNYGSMDRCYTTMTIKGETPGSTSLAVPGANRVFNITVNNDLDPASLPSLNANAIDESKTMYTLVGGEVRARIAGKYEQNEISFADTVSGRHVSVEVIDSNGEQALASARLWNAGAGSYSGDEIALSECLFTFDEIGTDDWKITANAGQTPVQLCTSHGAVTTADESKKECFRLSSETVKKASGDELTYFTFTGRNSAKTLFYWGWKMFTNNVDANEKSSKKNYGTARLLLYKAADTGGSCPELPGYQRVHEIVSGGEYLIAAVYENNMCFIHPSTGSGNNDYAAQRSNVLAIASTEISLHGLSAGENTIIFKNTTQTTVKVCVLGSSDDICTNHIFFSDTGSARGAQVTRLSISSGMQYTLQLRNSNGSLIPDNDVAWFSSNREYASIDQNGCITFAEPDYVQNQEPRYVTIYAYCNSEQHLHKLDVTVLKNDYGDTAAEINVLDYYIAQKDYSTLFIAIPMQGSTVFDETNFHEMVLHEAIYLRRSNEKPWALNFFVRPDEGHALTYLHANNSACQFYKLDNSDPLLTNYYINGAPVFTQKDMYDEVSPGQRETGFGDKIVISMIQKALDNGCVAAFGFTRQTNASGDKPQCALYVHSDPLPKVTKTVAYTIPSTKSDGTTTPDKAALAKFRARVRANQDVEPMAEQSYGWKKYSSDDGCQIDDIVIFKIEVDISNQKVADGINYSELTLNEIDDFPLISLIPDDAGNYTDSTSMSILEQMQQSTNYSFYAYHTLTTADAQNYNQGTEVYNIVTLTSKFTTAFQGSRVIEESSEARAALRFTIKDVIKYVNLTLDDEITANVYFDTRDSMAQVWASTETPYFVSVTSGGKKMLYRFTATDEQNKWSMSKTKSPSEYLYCRYSISIGIQDLFRYFTVHIEDQYGMAVTDDFKFSVELYVNKLLVELDKLSNQSNTENGYSLQGSKMIQTWCLMGGTKYALKNAQQLSDLLKAMLEFGYYTQVWMNDSSNPPPNPVEYQPLNPKHSLPEFNQADYAKQFSSDDNPNDGIDFTGIALEISDTKLGMRIYFTAQHALNLSKTQGVEQHLTTQDGRYYELTQSAQIIQADWKTYYVRIPNIPPKLLGSKYKVSIADYDKGNKTYLTPSSIKITPLAYVYLMKQYAPNGTASVNEQKLIDMLAAMYWYHDAARTYFGFTDYVPTT